MTNNISHHKQDTIVAIATAQGRAGVGVIRLSGPISKEIALLICQKSNAKTALLVEPRKMHLSNFHDKDNAVIDSGLVVYFAAPNSFTGEDVVELQGHGGPVLLDMLLEVCVEHGARLARPGEFSERAFINDKIDLVQAESIADLIDASSKQAAKAAVQSLQGKFSEAINGLVSELIALRVYVESAIDFPDEEIDFLTEGQVGSRTKDLLASFVVLRQNAEEGQKLRDGLNVVLVGQPNVGKSSLLNALAQNETAIVTEIPGTTRDILRETILIQGLAINLFDTAGLRETDNIVEKEGIERAKKQLQQADHILWIKDKQEAVSEDQQFIAAMPKDISCTIIQNKIDLAEGQEPSIAINGHEQTITLSAKYNKGIDLLKQHLLSIAGVSTDQTRFLARRRHLEAIDLAIDHIKGGLIQIEVMQAGELLAEELHLAQKALNEITGEFSNDDLLGEIFSSFCIGK